MIDKFIIGQVGPPHGLNGFVKVRSMSGEIDHLLELKEVTVLKHEKESLLKIDETKLAPPAVLMRFAGYDNPEKAKTLSGASLLAGREQAAPLGKDEFYIEDLKGLPVVAAEGKTKEIIGHITDIIEGGGGDLAEIKLESGGLKLVPFRKEFFPKINPKEGKAALKNLWILE
ncbi:MAG: ribosome maturation factor RimM [Treponema sp.]|nr:ribosome maturation factor RimM [Treponema sp.]